MKILAGVLLGVFVLSVFAARSDSSDSGEAFAIVALLGFGLAVWVLAT